MSVWEQVKESLEDGTRAIFAEFGDRLYATAYRFCLNETDAEDLVFRTVAQAVRHIGSYKGESAFFTWLCSIMANFRRMDLRRKGFNALVFTENIPESVDLRPDPAERMSMEDEGALIRRAVEALPESLRVPIVLFYFDGMGAVEIAKSLDVPEGTVYYRLHEARKLIRDQVLKVFPDRRI